MKQILSIIILCGMTFNAKAQDASVEKSTFGIQTGFFGVWLHNEAKLSNAIALRTEIGINGGLWGGEYYEKTGFLLIPVIIIEPRFYYNLNNRVKQSRRIDGNSGNFISLKNSYHIDWSIFSNTDNIELISHLSIVPTWGIRRNIGKYFNYEAGIGLGFNINFAKRTGYIENEIKAIGNYHLQIGYRFATSRS